jgi:amino acid permease
MSKVAKAIATLIGLIIGAGVLGLPYVFVQAGFLTGVVVLTILGLFVVLMNLYLGEITLRTKGIHQIPGYVEKYLGKKGKFVMSIALMISVYGALTGYLLGEGQAWSAIFGVNPIYPMLIFFILMSIIVFKGLKLIENLEFYFNMIVVGVLVLISIISLFFMSPANYTGFKVSNILVPYGVALFALAGSAAIPDLKVELGKETNQLKKVILIGSIVPLILYLLFATAVVGATGLNTSEVATVALGEFLGAYMIFMGNFLAIFTMATSFMLLALALVWMYHFDYKMKKIFAWGLTLIFPLAIALSGFTSFVQVLAITGTFAGGLEGIMIILTHRAAQKKSERKPEYKIKNYLLLTILMIAVYVFGMLYTLYTLFV